MKENKSKAWEIISELCQGVPYMGLHDEDKKEILEDIKEKKEVLKNELS